MLAPKTLAEGKIWRPQPGMADWVRRFEWDKDVWYWRNLGKFLSLQQSLCTDITIISELRLVP